MLRRKIETQLLDWKADKNHRPLVIKGVRQCGKTFIAEKFANENYRNVVYINFIKTPSACMAFDGNLDVDNIITGLSTVIPNANFEERDTCLILDEIQECPQARTALKFFHLDGRFDIIATGSLLGVKGYGKKFGNGNVERPKSIPVGYEDIVDMYPLDLEEFLWANGIKDNVINVLRRSLEEEIPVPELVHQRMMELFLRYIIVGGMPEAVNTFIETHNLDRVRKVQMRIIDEYKDDMVKYSDDTLKSNIRECFESIPRQLAKENKKFQYSVIKKNARSSAYEGCLQWVEDAGIIRRCYNLEFTGLPLDVNAITDCFKVYMCDTGLFVAMLEDGTQTDILQGNLSACKGALFENVIADVLGKMGRKLYYYHKDSGLEIDFVFRYHSECYLLEVKAKGGKTKSATTILKHPEKYDVYHAIKLGMYNVGRSEPDSPILSLPLYMAFLLNPNM